MEPQARKDSKEEFIGPGDKNPAPAMSALEPVVVDEPTAAELEEDSRSRRNCLITVVIIAAFVIISYLVFGRKAINWLYVQVTTLASQNTFGNILILLLIQIPFGAIPFLPGLAYFNIMQAIIMKNLFKSWLISFGGGYLVSLGVFLMVRKFFIQNVRNRFKHSEAYQMLLEETKEHPIRDGILFNFIFMPANLKNYLISITNLKFQEAAIAFIPGPAMLCFFGAMIGNEINDFSELFKSKSFANKTTGEKIQFIATIVLTIFSAVFVIGIGVYYNRRYKKFQEERKQRNVVTGVQLGVTEIVSDEPYDRL